MPRTTYRTLVVHDLFAEVDPLWYERTLEIHGTVLGRANRPTFPHKKLEFDDRKRFLYIKFCPDFGINIPLNLEFMPVDLKASLPPLNINAKGLEKYKRFNMTLI
jgi:hypothetical protein